MSKWGTEGGSKMGKDPQRKRLPKTWGKKRVNSDPKPYMKIMSRRGG